MTFIPIIQLKENYNAAPSTPFYPAKRHAKANIALVYTWDKTSRFNAKISKKILSENKLQFE